ncbi:AAA family ATPase [Lujinxingia vulgaris]|uniref:AAA family ATPase n=1 Tax=Lujinxingia vulgaris TaxID=2600176 RepID=A0A5C6X3Y8_9DELT|nr:AAA family ATPase [Lujinxingia vulgaris]TXD33798.1 AAA family ATPase [Lujinxingia vulgaris]
MESLIAALTHGLVERDQVVRLAVLAMLSGEHILLIGPPGTAKSEVARRLVQALRDGDIFERLLTRFSVPEDVFGPLSLKALEEDHFERKVDGYLPSASVAFIDEIFKANSAILNALLTLLNERKFDNGNQRLDAPLLALVGASNELPEDEVLEALYDRFLVRCHVGPVSDEGFATLLNLRAEGVQNVENALKISREDLEAIQAEAARVAIPESLIDFFGAMRRFLVDQNIYVSDRRWMKALKMLRVAAYTNGQDEVTLWECWLLQHCLWSKPEERDVIREWFEERVGAESVEGAGVFERLVVLWELTLTQDRTSKSQQRDAKGRHLFWGQKRKKITKGNQDIHQMDSNGNLLYLAPSGDERTNKQGFTREELLAKYAPRYSGHNRIQTPRGELSIDRYCDDEENQLRATPDPVLEPTAYSQGHIDHRVGETTRVLHQINEHIATLESEMENLEARIEAHLWVDTVFSVKALANLRESFEATKALKERMEDVREGFEQLPVNEPEMEV